MLPGPQAIIFDLDGTLLDSIPPMAQAINRILGDACLDLISQNDLTSLVGHGIHNLLGTILRLRNRPQEELQAWVSAYRHAYQETWPHTRPYPGIPAMLDHLSSRGIPLAILSNKTHDDTVRIVAHCLPDTPFSRVVGDGPYPLKPDPSGALELVKYWHLRPETVWMVGDGLTDVQTAMNATLIPVAVSWGFTDPARLKTAGAQVLLDTPQTLVSLCR